MRWAGGIGVWWRRSVDEPPEVPAKAARAREIVARGEQSIPEKTRAESA